MNITKTARGIQESGLPDREQLEEINRLTRRPLTAEEVYVFALRLCDNQVDRDNERFSPKTLEELAPMFVGKSGIFDHNWSARGQSARIFRTQLVKEPEVLTRAGDPCCWLKGWAYMVRTRENEGLIAEIEGGIKKEVSVGCAVKPGGMLHLRGLPGGKLRPQARGGVRRAAVLHQFRGGGRRL